LETQEVNLDRAEAQRLPGAKPGRYVQTTVSDTGVGMDAETASRVFEPFFTTKETGKGTGLGLSSVYGIVKRHQGFIYCHSRRGEGASFRILLPALEETRRPSRPPAEAAEAEGPASGGGTILLVDDEETLRTVGSRLLESAGYRVLTAASGEEAVELYRREGSGVDLVLMDLNMPGMGGRQAMDEIAALDPRAKVLVTTGYSDQPQVRDAASATGGGYLAKPFRRSELLSAVRRVLDGGPSRTS
jgi:CheY-like chemotaxis protein